MTVRQQLFFATLLAALFTVLVVDSAEAQTRKLRYFPASDTFSCEDLPGCAPDSPDCPARTPFCGYVGSDPRAVCHAEIEAFLCCDDMQDCVIRDDMGGVQAEGDCVEVSGNDLKVCEFRLAPPQRTFCTSVFDLDEERLRLCLTSQEGQEAVSWDRADCDGDGVSNGDETASGCVSACDPGIVPVGPDCVPPGPPDEEDAGTAPAADNVRFRGGGCDCSGAGSRPGAAWPIALFVGLQLLRRRTSRR